MNITWEPVEKDIVMVEITYHHVVLGPPHRKSQKPLDVDYSDSDGCFSRHQGIRPL